MPEDLGEKPVDTPVETAAAAADETETAFVPDAPSAAEPSSDAPASPEAATPTPAPAPSPEEDEFDQTWTK